MGVFHAVALRRIEGVTVSEAAGQRVLRARFEHAGGMLDGAGRVTSIPSGTDRIRGRGLSLVGHRAGAPGRRW